MAHLFFDSSALAKRYMPEVGTKWVRQQTSTSSSNSIVIAQITPVELYSAMSRQYHDSHIDLNQLRLFRHLLTRHVQNQYLVAALSHAITESALSLHERYRLRAYDAVQLATAVEVHSRLLAVGQTIAFIAADIRLLEAATAEGLATDNPNNYPS